METHFSILIKSHYNNTVVLGSCQRVARWLLWCFVWLPGCCYVVGSVFWVVVRVIQ